MHHMRALEGAQRSGVYPFLRAFIIVTRVKASAESMRPMGELL